MSRAMLKAPPRTVYVEDEVWAELRDAAAQRTMAEGARVSVAELVRRAILRELAACAVPKRYKVPA